MAEPMIEYIVGFVYSAIYRDQKGHIQVIEGELLDFDDIQIEIKAARGSVKIELIQITKISRK